MCFFLNCRRPAIHWHSQISLLTLNATHDPPAVSVSVFQRGYPNPQDVLEIILWSNWQSQTRVVIDRTFCWYHYHLCQWRSTGKRISQLHLTNYYKRSLSKELPVASGTLHCLICSVKRGTWIDLLPPHPKHLWGSQPSCPFLHSKAINYLVGWPIKDLSPVYSQLFQLQCHY